MEQRRFDELIGQEEIVRHLQHAMQSGSVAHAYLFSGETGCGKKTMASLFAMALLCTENGADPAREPCGKCTSCIKAASGNHPDIIFVTHEKPAVITVDEIREQVVATAEIKPYESRYKVYIIPDADKMNVQAQNALLKTLEEPPAYVVMILLAANRETLLETIRSRTVRVDFKPVSQEKIRGYLTGEMHVPAHEAEIIASFAEGNIGRARSLAMGGDFSELLQSAIGILLRIREMSVKQCIEVIGTLTQEKQNIFSYLDLFTLWYRDVLLFKATKDVDTLLFKGRIEAITKEAQRSSYEGLEKILAAIETAKARLKANVSFDITMELLLLTIMEN